MMSKYDSEYEKGRIKVFESFLPAPLRDAAAALDIGAGVGFISRILCSRGYHVTAIEADGQKIAHAFAGTESHPNVKYVEADAVSFDYGEDRYDLIVALELLEHLDPTEVPPVLAKWRRGLKPGGTLIVSTPNWFCLEGLVGAILWPLFKRQPWRAWDTSHRWIPSSFGLMRLIREAGFVVTEASGYFFFPGVFIKLFKDRRSGGFLFSSRRASVSKLAYLGYNFLVIATPHPDQAVSG